MLTLQIVFALLFGLAFGSFLNVCISRLPRHHSIVRPPSQLPALQGTHRRLRQHSAGELSSAARPLPQLPGAHCVAVSVCGGRRVAALSVGCVLWFEGIHYWSISFVIFCSLLLALAVCDAETMRLPDSLTLPLLGLGVLYRAGDGLFGEISHGAAYAWHAAFRLGLRGSISAAATALALLLLRWIYALVRRRQGLGLGDVKLAAAIAAWLGARQMCVVFFLAVVAGAVTALILLAVRRRKRAKSEGPLAVPFGTFLALAGIYCPLPRTRHPRVVLEVFPLKPRLRRK